MGEKKRSLHHIEHKSFPKFRNTHTRTHTWWGQGKGEILVLYRKKGTHVWSMSLIWGTNKPLRPQEVGRKQA